MEFYDYPNDDLSPLVTTTQNEYKNNVFDDILNSSEAHIDTSPDLNELLRDVQNEHDISGIYHIDQINDLTYCLDSISSMSELPYFKQIQESSKYVSLVDENENVDDLNSYLNYVNISQLGCDGKTLNTHDRNTPSPTGSCSSSSGSSTSGVQSDISDASLNRPLDQVIVESVKVKQFIKPQDEQFNIKLGSNFSNLSDIEYLKPQSSAELNSLSSNNTQNNPIAPSFNLMNNKTYISTEITNLSADQTKNIGAPLKPKTIVLSSRDYRSLMQKIHPSGAKAFSKINVNIPKNVTQKTKIEGLKIEPKSNLKKKEQEKAEHSVSQMLKHTNGSPKFDFLKSLTADEKMYKKQQRLIKNRESAYLSRKKRKEYVVALETRINKLEQENYFLKDVSIDVILLIK
ncbi:probable basic-leucine zipper transcription factor D [Drosophila serrata]|uniref:probable basic-leucine zipper transcription factor D n=1 Tax=Drosophila serrata TaxID=7274 RepID=UPI000A1D16CD|nr:probable basic-leucine zipper transcription factor D [Drosophila serrata]